MRKQVTYKQKGTQTEQFDDLFLSDESLTSADEGTGGNNNSSNASFNCYDMNDGVYSIETTLTNLSNSGSNTTIAGGKSNDGENSGQIINPHQQQRSSNHQHRRRKKSPKRRKSLPSQCSSNEEPHPVTLIPRGPLICSNSESSESWLLPNPYTANTALYSAINSPTVNSSSNTNVAAATANSTNPSSPLTINTSLTSNSPNILTSSPMPMSASILSKPISFTNPIFYDGVDGVENPATLPSLSNPVADSKIPSELFSSSLTGTSPSPASSSASPAPTTVTVLSKQTSTNNMNSPAAPTLTSTISSMKNPDKKSNETNATSKSTASGVATTERTVNNVRFKLQPRDSCYEGTRRVVTTKSISADPSNDYPVAPSMPKPLNLQQPAPKVTPVKLKRFNDKKPTHPALSPMGSSHGINSSPVGSTSVGTSTNSSASGFNYAPLINSSSTSTSSHSSSISASIQSALAKNKIINSIYPRDRIESTDYDNNDDFHDDDQLSSTEEENEVFIKLKLQKAEEVSSFPLFPHSPIIFPQQKNSSLILPSGA